MVKKGKAFCLKLAMWLTVVMNYEPAHARELAGIQLPETLSIADETLVLNGAGIRTKLIFKVYVAGLYLKTPAREPSTVEQTPGSKLILMHFLRDVDATSIRNAWNDGIRSNCEPTCETFEPLSRKLGDLMSDLRKDDTLSLVLRDHEVRVRRADKEIGVISGAKFGLIMLRVFLGAHPPTEELKTGLLGT